MSEPGTLQPYFSLRQLPTGRLVFSLKSMEKEARKHGLSKLVESIENAIRHGQETLDQEAAWEVVRTKRNTRRGDAMLIDNRLDRKLVGMEAVVRGHTAGSEDSPRTLAAKRLHQELFPTGVGFFTRQSFEIQLERTARLLNKCRTTLAGDVEILGLDDHLNSIEDLNQQLRTELEKGPPEQVTWDQVRASRTEGHELLLGIVAQILGCYWQRTPEITAIREELLAEYNRQSQIVAESRRRKRPVLDVNPDTGEEVELTSTDEQAEDVEGDGEGDSAA